MPSRPSFSGYTPEQWTPEVWPNYFDPVSKKLTPLSDVKLFAGDTHPMHEVLDSLTLALEAGVVSEKTWLKQIFGTTEAFEEFLTFFRNYDEAFRICDRWWDALSVLGKVGYDHEGFITCEEMATRLRESAEETVQL